MKLVMRGKSEDQSLQLFVFVSVGLSLILYLENAQYIPGLTSGYGARLAVGEPGQMVLPEYNGLYLSAGAETDVGLTLVSDKL